MYAKVPPGWCNLCLEGTSGPCRESSTLACQDYIYGNQCSNRYYRCADSVGSVHPSTLVDCPERAGDHFEIFSTLSIPTDHTDDWINVWGYTLSSAFADIIPMSDVCDVKILSAVQSEDQSSLELSVSIARKSLDDANTNLNQLILAVSSGLLMSSFADRGVPINQSGSIVLVSSRVAGIIAM